MRSLLLFQINEKIFLVNGVGTVDVAKLSSLTTFNDESSLNSDVNHVIRFQKWFWEVVEQFSQSERQELLYFWTGKFFKYWSILTRVFYRCTCTSSWRGSIWAISICYNSSSKWWVPAFCQYLYFQTLLTTLYVSWKS